MQKKDKISDTKGTKLTAIITAVSMERDMGFKHRTGMLWNINFTD